MVTVTNNYKPENPRYMGYFKSLLRQADEALARGDMAAYEQLLGEYNAQRSANGLSTMGPDGVPAVTTAVQPGATTFDGPTGPSNPAAVSGMAPESSVPFGLQGAEQASNAGLLGGLQSIDRGLSYAENALGGAQAGARADLLNSEQATLDTLMSGQRGGEQAFAGARDAANRSIATGANTARSDVATANRLANQSLLGGTLQGRSDLIGGTRAANLESQLGEMQARNDIGTGFSSATGAQIAGLLGGRGDLISGQNTADRAIRGSLSAGINTLGNINTNVSANNSALRPFIRDGQSANSYMAGLSGANGAEAQQAAMNRFMESPGQQYLREEAERALMRNSAATGQLGGGNTLQELQRNAIGLAAQDFDNSFNRLNVLAGRGAQAVAQAASNSLQANQASAGLRAQLGQAQADLYQTGAGLLSNNAMSTGQNLANATMGTGNAIANNAINTGNLLGNVSNQAANVRGGNALSLGGALNQNAVNLGQGVAANTVNTGSQLANTAMNQGLSTAGNITNAGSQIGASRLNAANQGAGYINQTGQQLANIGMQTGSALAGYGNNAANNAAQMFMGSGQFNAANRMNAGNTIGQGILGGSQALANLQNQTGRDMSNVVGSTGSNLSQLISNQSQNYAGVPMNQAQMLANISTGAGGTVAGVAPISMVPQGPTYSQTVGNLLGGIGSMINQQPQQNWGQAGIGYLQSAGIL